MYLRVSKNTLPSSQNLTCHPTLRHILSSVGRVATRDSSKEVAGTQDLFVALCEDDAIYPIFKVSKGEWILLGVIRDSINVVQSTGASKVP